PLMTSATTRSSLVERRVAGLRVVSGGAGRPVLLLHGLSGAARNWERIALELAATHRVLAPDLPGHGGSPPVPSRSRMEEFADRIALLVESERAAPALVAGHSFGGQLALDLAARRPELVRGVVAVAASGIGTSTRRAAVLVRATAFLRP